MTRDGRQRRDRERRLDPRQCPEMLAVAGRDRDVTRVDQCQVALGEPEHVEVVAEPWARVETPQDLGDPRRHPGRPERPDRHRPRRQPLEHEDVPLGEVVARPAAPTPAVAAARVLCSSLPRSTASSSVAAPGIRTKQGVPSTSTR